MNVRKLPAGYRTIEIMDFVRSRRQMMIVTILSFVLLIPSLIRGCIVHPPVITPRTMADNWPVVLAAGLMNLAYIPLHELTHGIFMRALSGVRPKYGLKLPYAYAGSRVWFDRPSHQIIALAPVVIWSAVLLLAQQLTPPAWFWAFQTVQMSNLSGSAGDIYCVWRLAHLPKDLLVQDTGTRMRICAPQAARVPDSDTQNALGDP